MWISTYRRQMKTKMQLVVKVFSPMEKHWKLGNERKKDLGSINCFFFIQGKGPEDIIASSRTNQEWFLGKVLNYTGACPPIPKGLSASCPFKLMHNCLSHLVYVMQFSLLRKACLSLIWVTTLKILVSSDCSITNLRNQQIACHRITVKCSV